MKRYRGIRNGGECEVLTFDEEWLNPRTDLHDYNAPFDWGNRGAGANQLALAILADYLENDEAALRLHQGFAKACVQNLQREWFELVPAEIDEVLENRL